MKLETTNNFKQIVLNETPLIDVRAPIEFSKGAFPKAVNIPILSDDQRHIIGIKYKEAGNEEATQLGYELVSGENKSSKVQAWINFINDNPNAIIYCFRGGSRSRITQEWIQDETGKEILRIEGGYKAFRNYLLDALKPENQQYKPIRITGHTGSGKSILLRRLDNIVDLEAIANHRGSAFGNFPSMQPTQINFESRLAYDLIQVQNKGYKTVIYEDEGRHVGRCFINKDFNDYTRSGDFVQLLVPFEHRVELTLQEYVIEAQKLYSDYYGDQGIEAWYNHILQSLSKIKKKIGGSNHTELITMLETGFLKQQKENSFSGHESWVAWLLKNYYDPMYEYQMANLERHIVFTGDEETLYSYLLEQQ